MASKFQYISELAGITLKKISSSGANWRSYLQTASCLYRYPFNEQVLIYAQRPDATACAGIDLWNNKMHRWVKRGAKGIALIDEDSGRSRLKYVFDISDTSSRDNIPAPYIWRFRKSYEPYLRETLSNAFGEVQADDAADFSRFIGEIAVNAVQDNGIDYVQELEQSREGSWLEDLDELNAEKWFNDLVTDSVTYCVLSRLGINPANILHDEDFRNICDFNTPETISILGTATSHISEMVLTVIAREVRSLEKQQFFDQQKNVLHNEVKQEERSVDHGTGIQDIRRVSNSGSERGGNKPDLGEIRHDAAELSQKPQEGDVQQPAVDQQTGEPFIGDGPIGKGTGESLDASDGEGSGSDRNAESHGSDEMGADDERHKAERRGNGDTGDDTQLEYYDRQREAKSLPFFHEDRKIKGILHSTPYLKATLKEIEDYFNLHSDSGERTAYIKRIFNNEPTELEVDGSLVGYKTYKNVLHLWEGGIDSPIAQGYYDWGVIANYYDGMLIMGELKSESKMFPTTSEQISIIRQAEEQKASAFVFPQELIDSVLQGGSHIEHGKYRICRHFEGKPDVSESVKFLKQEYGIGGHSPVIIGTGISEFHDAKGIRFTKDKDCLNLSWDKAAKRIGELIAADRYLNTKEKEYYPVFLEKEREHEQQTAEREYARVILGQAPEGSQPDEEKTDRKTADYRFNLGDTIYIGANEYQVLAFDSEIVRLYDNDYPLLNKEISRTEFDRFLRDTSLNDHLIVSGSTEAEPEQFVLEEKVTADDIKPKNHELTDTNQKVDMIKPPPKPELYNFRITDDNLGHGGAKTKYHNNVEAIKLLKSLETDHGFATPEEQEILSRYVGWGGLPQVFDEMNENWKSEFDELRSLLSSEEYASAKASTLSAYYTSPTIIKAIYKAVENMGFRTGNILEPSCGTGNFLGLIPDTMQNSKVYGIELDFITGGIAKQLYQKNNIAVQGFEDTELPDSFFDLSVGNVPFGSFTVPDKRYDKYKFLIHDYFFAKTLDKVRPGGIIVFVTSRGTMDKKNPIVRKYIAQRAELLGAIRLPNTAFQANAGTEVTADILFLQKRDRVIDIEPDWVHLGTTEDGIPINSYFAENSDMVLGTMSFESGMYGDQQTTCTPFPGSNLAEQLEEAILNIHADYESLDLNLGGEDIESRENTREVSIPADPNVRNFSYT